jgi:hypothetical protein
LCNAVQTQIIYFLIGASPLMANYNATYSRDHTIGYDNNKNNDDDRQNQLSAIGNFLTLSRFEQVIVKIQ